MSDFDPKNNLKMTKLIFTAIFIGPLIMLAMFLLSFDFSFSKSFELLSVYSLGTLAIIAIVLPLATRHSRRTLDRLKGDDPLPRRMAIYQMAMVIRLAGWEALALFAAISMIISAHVVYMGFFIVAMGGLLINYPSISSIEKTIGLSSDEIQKLMK